MALIATVPGQRGVIYENAYVRINRVLFFRAPDAEINKLELHVHYGVYNSAEEAQSGTYPHSEYRDIFNEGYDAGAVQDIWGTAYGLLKTRLVNAVDA